MLTRQINSIKGFSLEAGFLHFETVNSDYEIEAYLNLYSTLSVFLVSQHLNQ